MIIWRNELRPSEFGAAAGTIPFGPVEITRVEELGALTHIWFRPVPATESVAGRQDLSCGDPGPCVNGPDSHQWLISCQEDRS